MDIIIIFLFLASIKCIESPYNHSNSEKNLYFVFTTYRHGARTTFNVLDYFYNWITPAKITDYGINQSISIGKNYRERYSNFLNMNFDKNEFYIRVSDSERVKITTEKQLEGLFNKKIDSNNFDLVKGGKYFIDLFSFYNKDKIDRYFQFCSYRKLDYDDENIDQFHRKKFDEEIFPILKNCFGALFKPISLHYFCDSVFSAYYDYEFNNKKDNKIGKCGSETAKKMFDFCDNWFKTFKIWNEKGAYIFYLLYNHIFEYMHKSINGTSPIKMIMIGGHDITIIPFMDFLDKLKIIPKTEYPHFGFNIVIELRKYNDESYLEFYYNDILKYNDTLKNFKNILDNSKYSNLYNYCGNPPWDAQISNNTLNDTKKNNEINGNFSKDEIKKGNEVQPSENKINETSNIIKINDIEAKETDVNNIKIDEKEIKKENNNKNNINKNIIIHKQELTLKNKLKKLFNQEDDINLYIILGSILIIVIAIIIFIVFLIVYLRKRTKNKPFINLTEEKSAASNKSFSIQIFKK